MSDASGQQPTPPPNLDTTVSVSCRSLMTDDVFHSSLIMGQTGNVELPSKPKAHRVPGRAEGHGKQPGQSPPCPTAQNRGLPLLQPHPCGVVRWA